MPKMQKMIGTGLLVVGALMTLTIIGAIVGLPSVLAGWWVRRVAVSNIATIEAACAEHAGAAARA